MRRVANDLVQIRYTLGKLDHGDEDTYSNSRQVSEAQLEMGDLDRLIAV